MGAKDYRELVCWQLADQAKGIILTSTRGRRFDECRWLRSQLQRAISSACSNMVEGFARFNPKEFAHLLSVARASLAETLSHLDSAETLEAMEPETVAKCRELVRRSAGATTRLLTYLRSR